ncbi:MAG: DUF4381 domain-containing protein [Arenicellales bacterium]
MFEKLPLNDIHLPAHVPWWPPAIGWWLLLPALVLLYLLVRALVRVGLRRAGRRRLRRHALGELASIERDFDASGDVARTLERVSVLLRRVAVTVSREPRLAGRAGEGWVEWLRRTGPRDVDPDLLEALAQAPYRPAPAIEVRPVLAAVRRWVGHALRHAAEAA